MSGARCVLPDRIADMTRSEMELAIREARLDKLSEDIARLYLVDGIAQMDVAAELYIARSTVGRRIPAIISRIDKTAERLKIIAPK